MVLDHNFDKFPEEQRKVLIEYLEKLLSELDTKVDDPVSPSRPDTSLGAKERERLVVPHLNNYQSALSQLFDKLKISSDLPDDSEWREYGSVQMARMPDHKSVVALKGHDILDRNACG